MLSTVYRVSATRRLHTAQDAENAGHVRFCLCDVAGPPDGEAVLGRVRGGVHGESERLERLGLVARAVDPVVVGRGGPEDLLTVQKGTQYSSVRSLERNRAQALKAQ